MQFNSFGNLDNGIITINNLDEVEAFLVKPFSDSETRRRNFEGLKILLDKFTEINLMPYLNKIWIDGSFTTRKLNPNDIDLIFFLNGKPEYLNAINTILAPEFQNDLRIFGLEVHCDTYYILDIDSIPVSHQEERKAIDFQTKYWMGQFGYDRNRNPKGIIELYLNKEVSSNAI